MPDDDLESRLRRTFAHQADQAPPSGPVEQRTLAAVRRGQQGRRAGWLSAVALRPVAVAASVLAVVGATAGGVALVHNLNQGSGTGAGHVSGSSRSATATATVPSTAPPTSLGVSAPPPGTGSGSAVPTSTAVRPTTGPVPKNFAVTDLSFVSADTGWALGTTPTCANEPCTSLLRTVDGGKHWVGLAPPVVDLATVRGCTSSNCVSGVRFANAHVGYLFGPKALYLTVDGGVNWSRQSGGAEALEVAAGGVLRVTTTTAGCPPGCTYRVQRADVGGPSWHTVLTTTSAGGDGVALARAGDNAFVQVYGHTAGGGQSAHTAFYSSTDAGQHWTAFGEPCPQLAGPSVEYDATALAPSPSGSVAVLCSARTQGPDPFVAASTNAGRTFVAGTRNADLSAPIAAASASVIFANVEPTGQPSGQLLRSSDGGKTWAVVATTPESSTFGGYVSQFLGFENATTGRWVSSANPYLVWTTRNGGATWTRNAFR